MLVSMSVLVNVKLQKTERGDDEVALLLLVVVDVGCWMLDAVEVGCVGCCCCCCCDGFFFALFYTSPNTGRS